MKELLRKLLDAAGYQLIKKKTATATVEQSLLTSFLFAVKKLGFAPSLAYDVGANRGVWASEFLSVFPEAEVVLFEPQEHLKQTLHQFSQADPRVRHRSCALSAAPGTASFFASSWDVTSRLKEPATSTEKELDLYYQVKVSTLDEESHDDGRHPDLIKIDVEGEEINVLRGGSKILSKVSIVIMEVGICIGNPSTTVLAITSEMNELGYDLMGIVNLNPYQTPSGKYVPGVIWLADFAFVNRLSPLCEGLRFGPDACIDSSYV